MAIEDEIIEHIRNNPMCCAGDIATILRLPIDVAYMYVDDLVERGVVVRHDGIVRTLEIAIS